VRDGKQACELAYAAGITAQTASSHLGKMLDGGLLLCETEGRHRYYRLAGSHVAQAIEQLASIHPVGPVRRKSLNREARQLSFARCCYDHLAGNLGVKVTRGLQDRGFIVPAGGKQFEVTVAGWEWFEGIGLDMAAVKPTRRGLARQCLDWTERTHHLAGPLGVRLMAAFCAAGWLQRSRDSRAVQVTPKGKAALKGQFGITLDA
jgi:predicted transcriptional regulator